MSLIGGIEGSRLEIRDTQGQCRFVFEAPVPEADPSAEAEAAVEVGPLEGVVAALGTNGVEAPLSAILLPAERLLLRPFGLPFEHPRFIDASALAQELADQAGVQEQDWWLAWEAKAVGDGVRGLVFGLPEALKETLEQAPSGMACPVIAPDIAVRLAASLPGDVDTAGVLDADADGLMLGVCIEGVWRGMRRLNLTPGKQYGLLAREAVSSLRAMGFDAASMPVYGRLHADWKQALDEALGGHPADWRGDTLEGQDALPARLEANAMAMGGVAESVPFNFRHGSWAVQTDWGKRFSPWKQSAVLLAMLAVLGIGHDVWQLHLLQGKQESARAAIEADFHRALPGVPMIDPLLQLRQAAGGGASASAWLFVRQLEAITRLGGQANGFEVQTVSFSDGEVLLGGTVPDFAAANRLRDVLAGILGRPVELLDTDLNDKQVRVRLRWGA